MLFDLARVSATRGLCNRKEIVLIFYLSIIWLFGAKRSPDRKGKNLNSLSLIWRISVSRGVRDSEFKMWILDREDLSFERSRNSVFISPMEIEFNKLRNTLVAQTS